MRAALLVLLAALPVALPAAGCRGVPDPPEPAVVEARPPSRVAGLARTDLLRTPTLSAHLVATDEPLPLHVHREHDELVHVLSGRATMRLGGRAYELEPGSLVHVPRGLPHAVEPHGPVAALTVFTPPFDGRDRHPVDG